MAKAQKQEEAQEEAVEPATPEEAVEPATPKVTSKDPMEVCTEPKPDSKKDIVYQAGISKDGGSIKELAELMECTTSNVRQHIAQCHTKLGFGYEIEGDHFRVLGMPTVTWKDQEAEKEAKKAEKKKETKAEDEAASDSEGEEEVGGEAEDFLE